MDRKFYYLLGVVILATILYNLSQRFLKENFVDLVLPKPDTCIKEDCNKGEGLSYSSLYTSEIPRSLYFKEGRLQDDHYSSQMTPKLYDSPCLSKKPYGNASATYRLWKEFPKLLAKQYKSCDEYTCSNEIENGYNALPRLSKCIKTDSGKVEQAETLACDVVNQEYYNSPEEFCRTHPEDYPCPNWWLKNPQQICDASISLSNLSFPTHTKMKPQTTHTENDLGYCLAGDPTCELNDGRGLLMIQRGREDHGLC